MSSVTCEVLSGWNSGECGLKHLLRIRRELYSQIPHSEQDPAKLLAPSGNVTYLPKLIDQSAGRAALLLEDQNVISSD